MKTEDPRDQLLECADILVSAAEWNQAVQDWQKELEALTAEYADAKQHPILVSDEGAEYYAEDEELESHPAYQRWLELMEKIKEHGSPPRPPFTEDELTAALWQLPELAIGLLMVFTETLDEVNLLAEELHQRDTVSEIIRPQLYVPGQG